MKIFDKLFGIPLKDEQIQTKTTFSTDDKGWRILTGDAIEQTSFYTSIAMTCINKIAECGSNFNTYLFKGKDNEVFEHEFLDAIQSINKDNQNWNILNNLIWQSLYIYRKAYVYAVPNGNKLENFILFPTANVKEITDKNGYLTGIEWNGTSFKLWEEVLYFNIPDVTKKNVSTLKNARNLIDVDNLQQEYNKVMFHNFGIMCASIEYKNKVSPEKAKAISDSLKSNFAGVNAKKSFMFMILDEEGKLNNQTPKLTDNDISAIQENTVNNILMRFGVPKVLVGNTDSETYASVKTAKYEFIQNTIVPVSNFILFPFDYFVKTKYGKEYRVVFEYPKQLDSEEVTIIRNAYNDGVLYLNEYRKFINYGSVPGGDTFKIENQTISGSV